MRDSATGTANDDDDDLEIGSIFGTNDESQIDANSVASEFFQASVFDNDDVDEAGKMELPQRSKQRSSLRKPRTKFESELNVFSTKL